MINISSLTITPELLTLIAEIDEFKGAWQLFGRLAPERLNELRKVATIESIGSSTRIEGSKLSDSQVEELLSNIKRYSFKSRDEQEVGGYAFVCEEVFSSYDAMPFTENTIKQLHEWLLKYSHKDERHRGHYKKLANHVEAFNQKGKSLGVIFETSTPFETPLRMEELVYWTREQLELRILHPLLVTGIFIVIFLAVHPFQDGNGRLSRILTTLLLLKMGYSYVPYSSLESVIEENKEGYYVALRRSQQTFRSEKPDFTPWLLFFLRSLRQQKLNLEKKVARERFLHTKLPPLAIEVINLINEHGSLDITQITDLTKANRNTLKKLVVELAKNAYIVKVGKGRATKYKLS